MKVLDVIGEGVAANAVVAACGSDVPADPFRVLQHRQAPIRPPDQIFITPHMFFVTPHCSAMRLLSSGAQNVTHLNEF